MTDRLHWKNFFSVHRPVQFRRWTSRSDHYAHDHDFYELVLVTGGSGEHLSADGRRRIGTGDAILLTPGTWHEYSGCEGLSGFDCCFGKDVMWRELTWLTDDPVLAGMLLRHPASTGRRRPVVSRLQQESVRLIEPLLAAVADPMDDGADGSHAHVGGSPAPRPGGGGPQQLFGTLLVLLGRFLAGLPPGTAPEASIKPSIQALVRRTVTLMEEDLTTEWTLDGLSGAVGVSTGQLARAFRGVVGRSPMAHFRRCRVEHAAMLLLRSDLPVSEVGARVGIFDANYFARCFRSEMGLQPSAYRLRFQGGPEMTVPC
jgi:AraC family transcriptional regulator, L-rhamnose operon transcriptional activator RhaR